MCVGRQFQTTKLPAHAKGGRKLWAVQRGVLHRGEQTLKVVLEQVLQEACRDGGLEVFVGAARPSSSEGPNRVWLPLYPSADRDDRLPAWIELALRCTRSREHAFRRGDRVMNSHL